jgi:hypothetical protein
MRCPILRRLALYWPFKLVVGGAISMAFFSGYFLLQRFPVFPVTQMPVTALDRLVGFHPHATLLYLSLWLYIPISPWLADSKRDLLAYSSVLTAMCMVGLVVFFLWPTAVSRPAVDNSQPLIFRGLVWVDGPNNACPSLHAAFAVFSAMCNHRTLRRLGDRRWLCLANWCWCAGILYATLATRQHVVVDLLAGSAHACLGWVAFAWMGDGRQKRAIE